MNVIGDRESEDSSVAISHVIVLFDHFQSIYSICLHCEVAVVERLRVTAAHVARAARTQTQLRIFRPYTAILISYNKQPKSLDIQYVLLNPTVKLLPMKLWIT